jgi:hypothetical protein
MRRRRRRVETALKGQKWRRMERLRERRRRSRRRE